MPFQTSGAVAIPSVPGAAAQSADSSQGLWRTSGETVALGQWWLTSGMRHGWLFVIIKSSERFAITALGPQASW